MKSSPHSTEDTHRMTLPAPIRVLIVDDRAPAREGLRALLSVLGDPLQSPANPSIVVIGEACDSTEAIRIVEERAPDVVLMDVRMPGISGLEATRLIKGNWPSIRVVLMSFYGVHRVEALNAGADSFLLKGCPPEELLKAIIRASSGDKTSPMDHPRIETQVIKTESGG